MSATTPDTFRRDWHYAVEKDFCKDGKPAEWARGYPATWGDEHYKFTADAEASGGAFSHDEKFLAVIMGGVVKIYAAKEDNFELRETLAGPTKRVTKVEWQPVPPGTLNGEYLLVSDLATESYGPDPSGPPQVALWHLSKDGRQIRTPKGTAPNVRAVAGAAALEVSELLQKRYKWGSEEANDKTIRADFEKVIEAAARRHQVASIPRVDGGLFSFGSRAFSHAGDSLIVSTKSGPGNPQQGEAKPYIDVWDIKTSKPTRRLRLEGHTDSIMWVGTDPADRVIASSCWDRTVKIWDFHTGELIRTLGPSSGQNWTGVFSPDGQYFAHGCGGHEDTVRVWDIRSGECITKLSDIRAWARAFAWSPDGQTLAIGASGGMVRLIDPQTGEATQDWRLKIEKRVFGGYLEIRGMQYIDRARKISFCTGSDNGVEVYDLEENRKWRVAPGEGDKNGSIKGQSSAVWWQAKHTLVVFDGDQTVRFWKLK